MLDMTSSPPPSPLTTEHASPAQAHRQRGFSSRRGLLLASALAAVAGGFWFGLRRAGPGNESSGPSGPARGDASAPSSLDAPLIHGDQLTPAFWQQAFDTPGGPPLTLARFQGKPLLINFWATWCPPCVKEMPELDRFSREFAPQGWQVLGLAIDGPTPVREFLGKVKVGFAIGLAGFGGTELAQALGNQSGGLPYTVLLDAQGRVRHRKMGATHAAELAEWARAMAR